MKHTFDPECLGCAAPGELPAWLAAERDRADELEQRAKAVREDADRATEAALKVVAAYPGWQEVMAAQREEQRLHGQANALAGRAMNIRAHADRVEAAHPAALGMTA